MSPSPEAPATTPAPIVYVVDDDESLRAALRRLLEARGYRVETYPDAEAVLARSLDPRGCLLLDVRMPGMDGLELQSALAARGVRTPVIMISGHGDIPMAVRAVRAGAADFVEKPFSGPDLLARIRAVLESVAERPGEADHPPAPGPLDALTPREREVLALIVEGLPNKAVAKQLDLSVRTVEVHRANAKKKLGVGSVAEMVRLALAAGIASGGGSRE